VKTNGLIHCAEHPVDDAAMEMQMSVQRRAEAMDEAYGAEADIARRVRAAGP
jgi:hypothetical protein